MMTHFSVKNYKCLADVGIPLTPMHVIIGQNDSGKTSLLDAILALHKSSIRPLARAFRGRWEGLELVFEGAKDCQIDFEATFADLAEAKGPLTYHLSVEFQAQSQACLLADEWFEHGGRKNLFFNRNNLSGLARRHILEESLLPELQHIVDLIGNACLYRLDPSTMAEPATIDPERTFRLAIDGYGLSTLLDDLLGYDPLLFLDLSREFCEHYPQFRRLKLATEEASFRKYTEVGIQSIGQGSIGQGFGKGIYFETIHGRTIRAQQASDGAILFLGLLALMRAPNPPKLLLLEEPEKGVYPKRLAEVIALLRKLEADSVNRPVPQIILTTHSPYLLSSFRPEEVTLLRREGGTGPVKAYPLRDAPHIKERMGEDEFYLGELWYNLSEEELLGHA